MLAACQSREHAGSEKPEPIVIGHRDSLQSAILDETRHLWIHVPGDAGNGIYGQTKYPVLYLLDGPGHFHSVTGLLGKLAESSLVPEMVVVAIPNTDRTRDLTPSHVDEFRGDSSFVKTSGGGDAFLDFLEKELIPYIEGKYPVTPYRTYVGHSFGGIAVLHSLFTRPELFNNYISIDPSMWWDDWLLVEQSDESLARPEMEGRALFVGVANIMEEGMDIERVREDTASSSNHIRSILRFVEKLDKQENPLLVSGWKYYADDDHGSVPLITEYDGLRFLFSWYRLKGLDRFFTEDAGDDPEALLKMLEEHYAKVSKHFGYKVPPAEGEVNSLGYNFMNMKKPLMSRAMFELNIRNYPESANVYDSMGDFFLNQGDTLQAIGQFQKALELGNAAHTRDKLKTLKQKQD